MDSLICQSCQKSFNWDLRQSPVGRADTCPMCDSDLKVCLNCRHYDPQSRWECREHINEPVRDKDRANFCGEFQYSLNATATKNAADFDPKSAAEALFKNLKQKKNIK